MTSRKDWGNPSKSQSISCNSVEGQIFLISEDEKHLHDQIMRTSQQKKKNTEQKHQTTALNLYTCFITEN